MADPAFPRGGANPEGFDHYFQKLHENEDILAQRGNVVLVYQPLPIPKKNDSVLSCRNRVRFGGSGNSKTENCQCLA